MQATAAKGAKAPPPSGIREEDIALILNVAEAGLRLGGSGFAAVLQAADQMFQAVGGELRRRAVQPQGLEASILRQLHQLPLVSLSMAHAAGQADAPTTRDALIKSATMIEALGASLRTTGQAVPAAAPGLSVNAADAQAALLERTGGAWTPSQAQAALGRSRQDLHAKLQRGTIFSVPMGRRRMVPCLQFIEQDGRFAVPRAIGRLTRIFATAGAAGWPMLEYLSLRDPNLGTAPMQALRDGRTQEVIAAAQAWVGLDEPRPAPRGYGKGAS